MAEKESSPKQWSDPKDFGLPFVEITPLSSAKSKTKAKEIQPEVVVPVAEATKVESAPKQEKKKDTKQSRPVTEPKSRPEKKSSSKTWVWVVVFAFVGAVSVIVWQLQSGSLLSSDLGDQGTDSLAKEDSLTNSTAATNLPAATNSGTNLASTNPLSLTPITSKGEKKRFFLVIASLPNESLIKDFAAKMTVRPTTMYLINPYTNSPNHRLAIGKFDTWNAASDELAKVKAQYAADLWILNY